eukprot:gene19076-38268_t
MQGVRLIGTTLWSDYDALGEHAPEPTPARHSRAGAVQATRAPDPLTHRLRQREKAFRAANHYLHKMAGRRNGRLFDAEAMRALALDCQAWLREALDQPFKGPTVVITHFAPSLHSADPRYGLTPGTAGFCNALDDLLPLAHTWLHGHLHCAVEVVQAGCRIVANPLGYARKGEQQGHRPGLLVEVVLAPTKTKRLVPCGSWPASECSPAVMTVHWHESPAELAPTNTAWPGLQTRVHCQIDGAVLRTHPHPMPEGSDLFIGDHLARSVRGIPGAPPAQRR